MYKYYTVSRCYKRPYKTDTGALIPKVLIAYITSKGSIIHSTVLAIGPINTTPRNIPAKNIIIFFLHFLFFA